MNDIDALISIYLTNISVGYKFNVVWHIHIYIYLLTGVGDWLSKCIHNIFHISVDEVSNIYYKHEWYLKEISVRNFRIY